MKKIIYNKIIHAKIQRLKPDKEKKFRQGIYADGNFYDLSSELKKIRKEEKEILINQLKKAILDKSEKIIDKPTGETTHMIISIGDFEKLNLRR
jgi:hypothetical protein